MTAPKNGALSTYDAPAVAGTVLCQGAKGATVREYRQHLERRGLSPATIKRRMEALESLRDYSGDLIHTSTEQIEQFLDSKRGMDGGPLTAKTRYGWISHLACFFEWLVNYGHVDRDPTLRLDRPKLRRYLPRPISEGDLAMALEAAAADRTMYAWLVLAAYAGLRCHEIAGLTADSVMLDVGLIRVVGKGETERVVPTHPLAVDALLAYRVPRSGFVFRRPRGGRWYDAAVSREAALFFDGLGMEWRMHSLRHRFGTKALEACGNLRTVQELMGHANPATTAVYTAYMQEAGRAAVEAIGSGAPVEMRLPFHGELLHVTS